MDDYTILTCIHDHGSNIDRVELLNSITENQHYVDTDMHLSALKQRGYISIDLGGRVRLLSAGVTYLDDLKQQHIQEQHAERQYAETLQTSKRANLFAFLAFVVSTLSLVLQAFQVFCR